MNRLFFFALFWTVLPAAAGAGIRVAVSVAPVHSLIAGVMAGTGSPELILKSGASPHDYSLTPAAAALISRADLIFWVGPGLESSLLKPLAVLAKKARIVTLAEAPGVRLTAPTAKNNSRQAPYIWLDPAGARAIVRAAVAALSKADPANAARYTANGRKLDRRLAGLDRDLRRRLAPLAKHPFMVYHNAFAYLQRAYGLKIAGPVGRRAGELMSAGRLRRLRALIRSHRIRCLFIGPLQSRRSVRALTDGLELSLGVLDPLGMEAKPGPALYFHMMENLARALEGCLSPAG
jgi:zinc transport system substrate-binding protein